MVAGGGGGLASSGVNGEGSASSSVGASVGAAVGAASASSVISIGTTSVAVVPSLAEVVDEATTGDGALKGTASAFCRLAGGAL